MRYLKLLTLCTLPLCATAQEYSFIPYNVEAGLSQTQISSICQDDDGHIWFGTAGGASRFDGKNFKNYSKNDGLLDNLIIKIQKDSIGQIWLASDYGINSIKKNKVKSYRIKETNKSDQITDFIIEGSNSFYVAIRNKGLYLLTLEEKTTRLEKINTGNLSTHIRCLFKDSEGKLWIGTNNEVAYIKKNEVVFVDVPLSRQMNVSKIIQDKKDNIWIATVEEGVYRYDGVSFYNYNTNNGLLSYSIRDILEDHHGNIWFTSKIGVSKLGKRGFQEFTPDNGLEFDNVKVVAEDAEGNIWFGTDGSGVLKFTGDAFVTFTTRQDLSSNYVMTISQDKEQNYWFGTYGGGVCRYDGSKMTAYDRSNSNLANNTVWSSICDKSGRIWFSTSGGVSRLDGDKFKTFTTTDGLLANKVTALYEDKNGVIWFGMANGISSWNQQEEIQSYDESKGFGGLHVRSINQDRDGLMWLGCSNGLYFYKDGNFDKVWDTLLVENTIYSIEIDYKNNLWIGTANGIIFYDKLKFRKMTTLDAFSANYINFLKFENINRLWAGTNFGLLEIILDNFYTTEKIEYVHYTRSNGIPSLETNLNAAYKDNNGDMWFGTGGGLTRFSRNAADETNRSFLPFLSLNDVKLFLETTDWEKKGKNVNPYTGIPVDLKLKYNQNHLSFLYTGISHSNPSKVRFRYKLIGLDEDWSPILYSNVATYSNLPHGNFTFMVQSSIDGDLWTDPVSFSFEISPPFWLTWWFYMLVALMIISIIYLYVNRVKKTEQQKRENELIKLQSKLMTLEQQSLNASMNRHFIFNSLNSIQYYINTQDKLAANRYLTNFAKLIRKNLDSSSSGESLVSLTEELERLELYLSLENMRFQNKFTYEINIDPQVDTELLRVPGMFLQPYVENSIWHGVLPMEKEGHIKVNIEKTNQNTVKFTIEDNGIGIETSMERKKSGQKHQSKGMEITRSRIALLQEITQSDITLNGPYQFLDEQNNPAGTRVEIEIALHSRERK